MARPLLSVVSLLLSAGLLTTGNGLLNTLVSLRTAIEGFSLELTGLIQSSYFAGLVAGSLVCGRLIERIGPIRSFAAFAALLTVSALGHGLVVAPVPWLGMRAVTGLCVAGELMVAESWLNACATNENRGRIFSVYMSVIFLAFGGGQFLLGLRDPAGSQAFDIAAILLALSILPIVRTRQSPPAQVGSSRMRLRDLAAGAPLGVAGSASAGLVMGAVQALGPRFAGELGFDPSGVARLMGVIFLSGLLLQWPIGRLSDRVDRRNVITVMSGATAIVAIGIGGLAEPSSVSLLVLAAAFGGMMATIYPLSVAFANDRIRDQGVVAIAGGLLLANGLGAIAGPLGASFLMRALGPSGLFVFAAAVCALLALYTAYRVRAYAPVPAEEQERFVAVAQASLAALELDPRSIATSVGESQVPQEEGDLRE